MDRFFRPRTRYIRPSVCTPPQSFQLVEDSSKRGYPATVDMIASDLRQRGDLCFTRNPSRALQDEMQTYRCDPMHGASGVSSSGENSYTWRNLRQKQRNAYVHNSPRTSVLNAQNPVTWSVPGQVREVHQGHHGICRTMPGFST